MKYTIESRRDGLGVMRDSQGLHVVSTSIYTPYRFANLKQAQLALSGLQYSNNLHSGFRIHEVQS